MSAVRCLVVIYTNPSAYPPVERMSAFLRSRGVRLRVLGASGLETDAITSPRFAGIDLRLTSRKGRGIVARLRYLWFLLWACAHVLRLRPRWVHVSDAASAPVGLFAKRVGARVIYHEHDAPTDPPRGTAGRLIAAARTALLRRADLLVTPNAERSASLSREAGGRPVETVWNCPARDEVREHVASNGRRLRLLFQGSIVPERLPTSLIDAIVRSGIGVDLELVGYETAGSRGHVDRLRERARTLGMNGSVEHHASIDHEAKLAITAAADLGWALVRARDGNFNDRTMVGSSNKVFEYLACGVPAIVADDPAWRETFVGAGVAFPLDANDPDAIAQLLREAASDRARLEEMGRKGRARVLAEWNFETVFAPVAAAILDTNGSRA